MEHNNNQVSEPTRSCAQLEIDNAYLLQQNEHLNKELSFARYTINALKNITQQKDTTLQNARQELERALSHIHMLNLTLKAQQREMDRYVLSGMGPALIQDSELSDDQELSEEDEYEFKKPAL
ncbi:hypothetical protein K501DRAFT_287045, partial [Backusella circina FSU 941]